jgi:hypothetical protein
MAEQLPAPTTKAAPTTQPMPESPVEGQSEQLNRWLIVGGIVLAVLVLGILVGGTYWALQPQNEGPLRDLRDWAIVLVASMSCITGLVLVGLLVEIGLLTKLLRDEVKPMLESINETMNTVRGTTAFMSNNVVEPTIKVASTLSGVWRTLETLAGIRSSVQPKQRKE